MKIWLTLLIASTSVACGSNPPVALPDWEMAARVEMETADPTPLPLLCEIPATGTWTLECWQALDEYDIVATGNTVIAQANADALRKTEQGYDALIGAGKLQQQLSQIRQEMLERERREHTMDNWFYRIVIGLGLLAVGVN